MTGEIKQGCPYSESCTAFAAHAGFEIGARVRTRWRYRQIADAQQTARQAANRGAARQRCQDCADV